MDPNNVKDNSQNAVMVFFRDSFAKFLFKTWVKVLVLLSFVAYIAISSWGIMHVEEGLKQERLFRDDSYLAQFHVKESYYFKKYPHRIQVITHHFY